MSERHRERAEKVVESFRELLDEKVRGVIPDNDFEQLTIFVQEALADELHDAAEQVEELARQMRTNSGLGDIGVGFI
jgi:vacuolar-type H+-ATPase subunit E/Vma4